MRVSWDRPYGKYCQVVDAPLSQGSGDFLLWEFPLAFWMEQHGYDHEGVGLGAGGFLRMLIQIGLDRSWPRTPTGHPSS